MSSDSTVVCLSTMDSLHITSWQIQKKGAERWLRTLELKMLILMMSFLPMLTAARTSDVCNSTVAHPITLELGDTGTVTGSPVTSPAAPPEEGCRLHLLSCDSCRLRLTINSLSLPVCNESITAGQLKTPVCVKGCTHVIVYEPSYADVTTNFLFDYNATWAYYSISSSVVVVYCSNTSRDFTSRDTNSTITDFSLIYQVIEKQEIFLGSARSRFSSTGVLQSPNFPRGYALRGEVYKYLLKNIDRRGRVRVVFDDWDLADTSQVVFYHNETYLEPFSVHLGSSFRPVVLSSDRTLYMMFRPDVGVHARTDNMGFRARYEFVKGKKSTLSAETPITDCGMYYKYSPGGRIEFHGSHLEKDGHCDCVWVVSKHSHYTWLQLQIRNFSMSNSIILQVHEGVTSMAPLITQYNASSYDNSNLTLEGQHGYYIRLQGSYMVTDYMDITFVAFNRAHKGKCGASEFKCNTLHCIDRHLVCDGQRHCEEGEDERHPCQEPVQNSPVFIQCKDTEFLCRNRQRCVPRTSLCNSWWECEDGSDESACDIKTATVKPKTLSKMTKSTTKSPETVTQVVCLPDEWLCHSGDQCIPKPNFCDQGFHCLDKSDELDCFMELQSKSLSQAPWSILMPVGIALCVALFICLVSLCIRSHLKHQQECVQYSSGRPGNPSQAAVRRSRRPKGRTQRRTLRSITSETPLTLNLNLSRSTSGVGVTNNQADSPPSYEEAMRLSPEGCSDTVRRLMISHDLNCGFPGGNRPGRMSPTQLLTPPTYTPTTAESPTSMLGQTCFVFPSASDNAGCTGTGSSSRFGSKDRDKNKPTCSSCGSKHVINLDSEDNTPPVCADCSYSTPSLSRNVRLSTKRNNHSVENIFLQINGSQSQINLNSLSNNRSSLKGTKHQSLPRDVPGIVDEPVPSTSGETCNTAPVTSTKAEINEVAYDVKLPFRKGGSSSSTVSTSSSETSTSSPSLQERPKLGLRDRPLGHSRSTETDKSTSSDKLSQRKRPNLHRGRSMDGDSFNHKPLPRAESDLFNNKPLPTGGSVEEHYNHKPLPRGGSMDSEHFNQKRLQDLPLGGSMDAPGSCGTKRKFRDLPLGGSLDNNTSSLEEPVPNNNAPIVPPPRTTSLLASLIERGASPAVMGKTHSNNNGNPPGVSRSDSINSTRLANSLSQHSSIPIDSSFLKRSLGDSLPGIYETRLLRTPSPKVQLPHSYSSQQNVSQKRGNPYRDLNDSLKRRNQAKNDLVDSAISRDLNRHFKPKQLQVEEYNDYDEDDETYDVLFADTKKCIRPNFLNLNSVTKPKAKHAFNLNNVNPGSKHTVL